MSWCFESYAQPQTWNPYFGCAETQLPWKKQLFALLTFAAIGSQEQQDCEASLQGITQESNWFSQDKTSYARKTTTTNFLGNSKQPLGRKPNCNKVDSQATLPRTSEIVVPIHQTRLNFEDFSESTGCRLKEFILSIVISVSARTDLWRDIPHHITCEVTTMMYALSVSSVSGIMVQRLPRQNKTLFAAWKRFFQLFGRFFRPDIFDHRFKSAGEFKHSANLRTRQRNRRLETYPSRPVRKGTTPRGKVSAHLDEDHDRENICFSCVCIDLAKVVCEFTESRNEEPTAPTIPKWKSQKSMFVSAFPPTVWKNLNKAGPSQDNWVKSSFTLHQVQLGRARS